MKRKQSEFTEQEKLIDLLLNYPEPQDFEQDHKDKYKRQLKEEYRKKAPAEEGWFFNADLKIYSKIKHKKDMEAHLTRTREALEKQGIIKTKNIPIYDKKNKEIRRKLAIRLKKDSETLIYLWSKYAEKNQLTFFYKSDYFKTYTKKNQIVESYVKVLGVPILKELTKSIPNYSAEKYYDSYIVGQPKLFLMFLKGQQEFLEMIKELYKVPDNKIILHHILNISGLLNAYINESSKPEPDEAILNDLKARYDDAVEIMFMVKKGQELTEKMIKNYKKKEIKHLKNKILVETKTSNIKDTKKKHKKKLEETQKNSQK